jgi:hypothetical protein
MGSKAPDFDLPGVDGRNWKLSPTLLIAKLLW